MFLSRATWVIRTESIFMRLQIQRESQFNRAGFSIRFGNASRTEAGDLCGIKELQKKSLNFFYLTLTLMEFSLENFVDLATYGSAAVGVLILLYHEYKLLAIRDYKEKYDYVNLHEIRYFWYAIIAFIFAVALYTNKAVTSLFVLD